jgi:acyl-CoA synthetase (AMP-forming)/AMP-acid ligase II
MFTPLIKCSIVTYIKDKLVVGPQDCPILTDASAEHSLTSRQLQSSADSLAYGLSQVLDPCGRPFFSRGDAIMIISGNSLEWPIVLLACWAAGLCVTTASTSYTTEELGYQWDDCKPKAIFVQKEFLGVATEMLKNRSHVGDQEAKELIWIMDEIASYEIDNGDHSNSKANGVSSEVFRHKSLRDLLGLGVLDTETSFDNEVSSETALICYSSGTSVSRRHISLSRKICIYDIS